jgi:GNAT superfamily N-acetyltransferase
MKQPAHQGDQPAVTHIGFELWDHDQCVAQAHHLSDFLQPLFDDDDWSNYASKLQGRRGLSAIVARQADGAIIGLKMGYERNRGVFNSWIGGVAPAHRGLGLAAALMVRQHAWAKEAGFVGVETATRQHNRAMAIVNLKGGFVVSGLDVVPGKETKVIFYKDLVGDVA